MREVLIVIKQREVEKALEEMSRRGVNITQWFNRKVLEYEKSLD